MTTFRHCFERSITTTRYYYDVSGNRVRKFVYASSQVDPPPITDWSNPGTGWVLLNNEYYVKGVGEKDLEAEAGKVVKSVEKYPNQFCADKI